MGQLKGTQQGFSPELFRKAVKGSMERNIPVQIFDATVIAGSQDSTKMTCFVNSVNSNCDNLEVRYHLCISDGVVQVPADDSVVTVAKTAFTDPYIVKATDLNSYFLGIGNQSFENDGTKQSFLSYGSEEGSFGGMIKDVDPNDPEKGLLKALNNLQNDINNLKSDISNVLIQANILSTALSGLGGSPIPGSTLLPYITAVIANLTPYTAPPIPVSTSDYLENTNIIHGLKMLP